MIPANNVLTLRHRAKVQRRGAVLIVVLAMLALFAVVGLTFVLYSSSQVGISRNDRESRSFEGEPNPIEGAAQSLGVFFYDSTSPSALSNHGIARTRYGSEPGSLVPFSGTPNTVADLSTSSNVPFTYADRNNAFLARQNPTTGAISTPSYHRNDISKIDALPGQGDWVSTVTAGKPKMLRPRPIDHQGFPYPPPNADGTITGDVCNMRYINGSQQNDSVWLYTGAPVKNWRGKRFTYLVAPLVLDLSGRVNLSTAGPVGAGGSSMGYGPWEVNMGAIAGVNAAGVTALRNGIPNDRYTSQGSAPLNKSLVPPGYARVDINGGGAEGPIDPPPAAAFSPFPTFSARFEADQNAFDAARMAHPSQFSPLAFPRGKNTTPPQHAFGLDEVVRLCARYSGQSSWYQSATLNASVTTPQARALTTPFSVSSYWNQLPFKGTRLSPIDINRPLADYRLNNALRYHPDNMGNAANARLDRQNLARDIFVRLVAAQFRPNPTNGNVDQVPNSTYDAVSGYLTTNDPGEISKLRPVAQLAVNIVDFIDPDEISTVFVWNPKTPGDPTNIENFPNPELGNRVVFGTELPRVVLNEVFCALVNNPTDPYSIQGANRSATKNLQKKYWIELHNPLSASPVLSESGSARLQWQQNVSPDAAGTGTYAGNTYAPYRVDIIECPPPPASTPTAISTNFTGDRSNVLGDPALIPANIGVQKIALDRFTYDTTAPAATLTGDSLNIVAPANNLGSGNQGKNEGYYVLGPKDQFPSRGVTSTMCIADAVANGANPVPSMTYDTASVNPGTQPTTTSAILLRRLVNPYQPPQTDPNLPDFNPYMTVDFLENIPTRNRIEWDGTPRAAAIADATKNLATVGRNHPYSAAPGFGQGFNASVRLQTGTTQPPHTLFRSNTSLLNNQPNSAGVAGKIGLAWLPHFDRELINPLELLIAHPQPPHLLTQRFTGSGFNPPHYGLTAPSITASPFLDPTRTFFQALDLLSTRSRYTGTPLGGRIPGRVNVNAIQDPSVFSAVLDPQPGNAFNAALVSSIWTNLNTTIQSSPIYGMAGTPYWYQTLFMDTVNSPGIVLSMFQNSSPTNSYPIPYALQEPLRKAWNSLTTTSDSFLMIYTVGVFEVKGTNANGPILGPELGRNFPGDLRQQYAAVIDRSMMTVKDLDSATNKALPADALPWEVDLVKDAKIGDQSIVVRGTFVDATKFNVFRDGATVNFNTNDPVTTNRRVRIGFADAASNTGDGIWLNVTAVANGPSPGTVTLTVPALTRFYGAGTPVRNCILGNPGPQANFDHRDPKYQGVVPYFTRLDP